MWRGPLGIRPGHRDEDLPRTSPSASRPRIIGSRLRVLRREDARAEERAASTRAPQQREDEGHPSREPSPPHAVAVRLPELHHAAPAGVAGRVVRHAPTPSPATAIGARDGPVGAPLASRTPGAVRTARARRRCVRRARRVPGSTVARLVPRATDAGARLAAARRREAVRGAHAARRRSRPGRRPRAPGGVASSGRWPTTRRVRRLGRRRRRRRRRRLGLREASERARGQGAGRGRAAAWGHRASGAARGGRRSVVADADPEVHVRDRRAPGPRRAPARRSARPRRPVAAADEERPRWVSEALYPSGDAMVTVSPCVGTCPANVTSPDGRRAHARASPSAMSIPRCWPPA